MPLPPKPALAIALAVHELATNAAKYGALSNDKGRVSISWEINAGGEEPSFRFNWVEKGGPPVVEPDRSQRGFGTRLIERMLKNDFGGEVILEFKQDGLVCALNAPLKKLTTPEYQEL
jgi:two-component sensor histidine kinase